MYIGGAVGHGVGEELADLATPLAAKVLKANNRATRDIGLTRKR
jgi:hypothetical protein